MKVRDSEILAWLRGQRKMSQVLGAFGLRHVRFGALWLYRTESTKIYKLEKVICGFGICFGNVFENQQTN
jgi:hypothetical protein